MGVFAGSQWGLYALIPNLDKFLHLLGGLLMAWLAVALLQKEVTHLHAVKQALILISIAVFIGVLWELAEYAANFTRSSYPVLYHYFHGGDLADTLADLVCDTLGAIVLTVWVLNQEKS